MYWGHRKSAQKVQIRGHSWWYSIFGTCNTFSKSCNKTGNRRPKNILCGFYSQKKSSSNKRTRHVYSPNWIMHSLKPRLAAAIRSCVITVLCPEKFLSRNIRFALLNALLVKSITSFTYFSAITDSINTFTVMITSIRVFILYQCSSWTFFLYT